MDKRSQPKACYARRISFLSLTTEKPLIVAKFISYHTVFQITAGVARLPGLCTPYIRSTSSATDPENSDTYPRSSTEDVDMYHR